MVRRHFAVLERFFANKVHEGDRADLIQATLLECTRSVDRFRGESRFCTYLLSIARNVLLHHYRTCARKLDRIDPLSSSVVEVMVDATLGSADAVGERHAVWQALRRLPLELQMVIELRYFEHLTLDECAVVLGTCPSAVSRRIHRAKRRLRGVLGS